MPFRRKKADEGDPQLRHGHQHHKKGKCEGCLSFWRKFLHHKEGERDFYCGKTCRDWFDMLWFSVVYYSFVVALCTTFWFIFKSMRLDDPINLLKVPAKRGFKFANNKIKDERLFKLVEEVELLIHNPSLIQSHLDFPMLSHVPRRYGSDDYDDGETRNEAYAKQFKWFLNKNHDDEVIRTDKRLTYDCVGQNLTDWIKAVTDKGLNKWACKVNETVWNNSLCGEEDKWYNLKTREPCIIVKLNKITGFIPEPYESNDTFNQEIEAMKNDYKFPTMPDGVTKAAIFHAPWNADYIPIACWTNLILHGQNAAAEEKFMKPTNFTNMYLDMKYFPFMGFNEVPPYMVMKFDYTDDILIGKTVHLQCRAMARNIPYRYMIDIIPIYRFGYFTAGLRMYKDDNGPNGKAGTYYFKMQQPGAAEKYDG